MRISQRTTFAHWLMRRGRSRQLWIHFLYMAQMIVSEVGRMTSGSSSFSPPPWVTTAQLGREALDVLGFLLQEALGDEQGEVGVDVPGLLEQAVEAGLDALPDARSPGAG